jgi:hypothetical protein
MVIGSRNRKEARTHKHVKRGEHRNLFAILGAESERGCVLVAAAAIEEELESLLRTFFAKVNSPDDSESVVNLLFDDRRIAPLGTLWAKACLCRALSLIDGDLFRFFLYLKEMRNDFARVSMPVAINLEEVGRLHSSSEFVERAMSDIGDLNEYWAAMLAESESKRFSKQRLKFMTVVVAALAYLWATRLELNSSEWVDDPLPEN